MKAPRGPLPVDVCDPERPWWRKPLARTLLPPATIPTLPPSTYPNFPSITEFARDETYPLLSICSIVCSSHPRSRSSEFFGECDNFFNIGFTTFPFAFVNLLAAPVTGAPRDVISGNILG